MTAPTLRRAERDLYAAADELRAEDIPDVEQQRDDLVADAREEYGDPADAPAEMHNRYQQLTQQLRELHGTAETYEEYADRWSDGEACVFVVEELNGDEWAATIDAVRAEGGQEAIQSGTVPEGFGRVKALEYAIEDIPADCPPDPGAWPAPIVNELYSVLEDITAPSGVALGNSSLADAMRADDSADSDGTDMAGEGEETPENPPPAAE
jgi:hypothetical protein